MAPLKKDWVNIYGPLVDMMKLQVRMNPHKRQVEIRSSKHTKDSGSLQKGADFVKAYSLGFDVDVSELSFFKKIYVLLMRGVGCHCTPSIGRLILGYFRN